MAGLTSFAKPEILAKEPLLEHPTLELRPLAEPLLELWVVRVGQFHSFRGNKAVERPDNVEKTLCSLSSHFSPFIFLVFLARRLELSPWYSLPLLEPDEFDKAVSKL